MLCVFLSKFYKSSDTIEKQTMKEEFLHYLWRLRRFDLSHLQTTEGDIVEIHQVGVHNTHAGPDFTNARVRIGDTLWAGNVEMHLQASEWVKHQHQEDKAYDNVILHVVMEEDEIICRNNGERIPCLELKKHIAPKIETIYEKLVFNEHWIPCQHHFTSVSEFTRNLWLDRLLVERLEQKTKAIEQRLEQSKNDWEQTFYEFLARNFGVKVNAIPFELVAKSTPVRTVIGKHKNNLPQIEALLFGQAGLLAAEFEDSYPLALQKEYRFLQKKYQLQAIRPELWKFMRMRPANFPTIRIAQFATLIYQSSAMFSKLLEVENIGQIEALFQVKLSDYWLTHYVFDKESKQRNKTLGKSTIHLFIINTIVPFLFLYGKRNAKTEMQDKALRLLEELSPEKNSIISQWKDLGVKPDSAYQTQALLQLKNEYCNKKRCLECSIGNAILK